MSDPLRIARRVFRIAGIYGLVVLVPLFFAEDLVARSMPLAPAALGLPAVDLVFGLGFAWCWMRLRPRG